MLGLRLTAVLLLIMVLFILSLLANVRKERIELSYTLVWFVLAILLIILIIFPNTLEVIARAIGIESPMNALFTIAIFLSCIIIYTLSTEISKMSKKMKTLTQELALLSKRVEDRDKEVK